MSEQFRVAKDVLAGYARSLAALEREINRKCDWDIPDDVKEYKLLSRETERRALLDRFVPTRMCPCCGEGPFVLSKQWVYSKKMVVCKACFGRGLARRKPEKIADDCVFGAMEMRYPFDGLKLRKVRMQAKVGTREFARLAGWSRTYQQILESKGRVLSVTHDKAVAILKALKKCGIVTADTIQYPEGNTA